MLSRTPAPDQMGLWDTTPVAVALAAPDVRGVDDPAGMEQPSMFESTVIDPPAAEPFQACEECGLDLEQLHHEECGSCYCDGDPCMGDEEEE